MDTPDVRYAARGITNGLAINTRTLGDSAQTRTRHPPSKNLTNLDH